MNPKPRPPTLPPPTPLALTLIPKPLPDAHWVVKLAYKENFWSKFKSLLRRSELKDLMSVCVLIFEDTLDARRHNIEMLLRYLADKALLAAKQQRIRYIVYRNQHYKRLMHDMKRQRLQGNPPPTQRGLFNFSVDICQLILAGMNSWHQRKASMINKQFYDAWKREQATKDPKTQDQAARTIQRHFRNKLLRPVLLMNPLEPVGEEHCDRVFVYRLQYQHRPRSEGQQVLVNRIPPHGMTNVATGVKPHFNEDGTPAFLHSFFNARCGAVLKDLVHEFERDPKATDTDLLFHIERSQMTPIPHMRLLRTARIYLNRPDWIYESHSRAMMITLGDYLRLFKPNEDQFQHGYTTDVFHLIKDLDLSRDRHRARGIYASGKARGRAIRFGYGYPVGGLYTLAEFERDDDYSTGYYVVDDTGVRVEDIVWTRDYSASGHPLSGPPELSLSVDNSRPKIRWNDRQYTYTVPDITLTCGRADIVTCDCCCCCHERDGYIIYNGCHHRPRLERQTQHRRMLLDRAALVSTVHDNMMKGVLRV